MAYPILAPSNTWYKSSTKRGVITQINIVDSYTPNGNETEVWNADVNNSGAIKCYLNGTVLTIAGNGSGKIALNTNSSYLFSIPASGTTPAEELFINCQSINGLNLFDSSNVQDLSRGFAYCIALKTLDLSSWDVGNVTTFRYTFASHESVGYMSLTNLNLSGWNVTSNCISLRTMFQNCTSLTSIDVSNWDVSSVTDMGYMFTRCTSLTSIDVSNWDTSSVTNMSYMFNRCTSLTALDVSNWGVSSVTNMSYMFSKCTSLTTLDVSNWDLSSCTTINSMFSMNNYGDNPPPLSVLDVSNWNVSNITDMGWAFYGLANLKTLDVSKWDVSKVEFFHHCFAWCTKIVITGLEKWKVGKNTKTLNAIFHNNKMTTLDLSGWDVSGVENFGQMFEMCVDLKEIKGLENWDTSSAKTFYEMFSRCSSLEELNLSSFNTKNVTDTYIDPMREAVVPGGLYRMFGYIDYSTGVANPINVMHRLKKITLGENFSFNGNGTALNGPKILPTPNPEYIPGATGAWYNEEGIPYSPEEVLQYTPGTYYAFNPTGKEYLVKAETIKQLADAVRAKTGKSETINLADMITEIGEIPCGDTSIEDALITRNFSIYENNRVSSVGNQAFYGCFNLTSVSFPACTTIGSSAFNYCSNLTSINFPVCTTIGSYAFQYCSRLTSINFPACTTIGNNAFQSCTNLTTADFPACTTIGNNAFQTCKSLTTADFPVCTSIGISAFAYCSSLTTASFPACTYIASRAFEACKSLTTAYFPACTYIDHYAFQSCTNLTTAYFPACSYIGAFTFQTCTNLTTADFPVCTYISNSAFQSCTNLTTASFPACSHIGARAFEACKSLTTAYFPACTYIASRAFSSCTNLTSVILAESSVCTLAGAGSLIFFNTNSAFIYVPASLVASYKADKYWSTIAGRISAIEDMAT